ncbi:MAG TPA: RDD family protein, partial [Acidimicrobiales bacterium]|nr:RDD family protein [Acidimicrobiales bacterium]
MTAVTPPSPELAESRQGHYAGAVSRLVAFAVDLAAVWAIYTLGAGAVSLASQLITGHPLTLSRHQTVGLVILLCWGFVYFAYQWSLNGKTIGMALFGLQVVRVDGSPLSAQQAMLRTLLLPFSFALAGIGVLMILVQRERRALHDLLARTAVVYSWDARAARLRWL